MNMQTFTEIIVLYRINTFSYSKGSQHSLQAASVEQFIQKDNQNLITKSTADTEPNCSHLELDKKKKENISECEGYWGETTLDILSINQLNN